MVTRIFKRFIFSVLALCFLGQTAFAINCGPELAIVHRLGKYRASTIRFSTTHSSIKGYQIKGEGQTVLSLHGFSGDASNMLEFGRQLNLRGGFNFIAINALDHGQGSLRSTGSLIGRSKLPKAIRDAQDFYEIIEQEYKRTGKKVIVSGHSRGGMQQDLLAMAVDELDGRYFINRNKFNKLKDMVQAGILLAAPAPRNEGLSQGIVEKTVKNVSISAIAQAGKVDAPLWHSQSPLLPIRPRSFSEWIILEIIEKISRRTKDTLKDTDIVNVRMLTREEMQRFALHGSSGSDTRQMQELMEMMDPKGFRFRGIDLMDVDKEYAFPIMRVVGSLDRIGKAEGTASLAEDNIARAQLFDQDVIVVRNTSHLDVLNEAAVDSYINQVIRFVRTGEGAEKKVVYVSPTAPRIFDINRELKRFRSRRQRDVTISDRISLLVVEREIIKLKNPETIMEKAMARLTNNGLVSLDDQIDKNKTDYVVKAIMNAKKVYDRELQSNERKAIRSFYNDGLGDELISFDQKREFLISKGVKIFEAELLVLSGII